MPQCNTGSGGSRFIVITLVCCDALGFRGLIVPVAYGMHCGVSRPAVIVVTIDIGLVFIFAVCGGAVLILRVFPGSWLVPSSSRSRCSVLPTIVIADHVKIIYRNLDGGSSRCSALLHLVPSSSSPSWLHIAAEASSCSSSLVGLRCGCTSLILRLS